uniref:Uncharacterized protein n=1 Tax=Zea mays TaxID=4577 RepID=A0A804QBG5_MAIZE
MPSSSSASSSPTPARSVTQPTPRRRSCSTRPGQAEAAGQDTSVGGGEGTGARAAAMVARSGGRGGRRAGWPRPVPPLRRQWRPPPRHGRVAPLSWTGAAPRRPSCRAATASPSSSTPGRTSVTG